jgi:tetratricopeptide (TPR) repeat protein
VAVYGNRGNVYKLMKRFDEAIADYTYAINLNPRYAKVYYSRALVYLETKQYDEAIKDLETSSSLGFNQATERLSEVKKMVNKQ